jgi:hypothetical protein
MRRGYTKDTEVRTQRSSRILGARKKRISACDRRGNTHISTVAKYVAIPMSDAMR